MRKIKLTVKCRVPSWNFCNKDVHTKDGRHSKELCKFCVKSTAGYYCILHEEYMANDHTFVYKPNVCIEMTAGFKDEVNEPEPLPQVNPQLIIRETLKEYNKTVKTLTKQGYPQQLAETIATKYVLGEE